MFAAEDTLLVKWHNKSLSDTTRIISYEKYIWNEHIDKNSDSIEFHLDKLISFSKTKKSDLGLSLSLNIRGVLSIKAGRYDEAIDYFQQSIKIGNKYVRAKSQFNIAITNYYRGDFEQALKGFRKVISIYKELDSKADLASTYGNIGSVYKDLADYKMALESYNIALNIYKELNEKDKISYIY
jgi:tetratricopeptide (TPR) repeat protein